MKLRQGSLCNLLLEEGPRRSHSYQECLAVLLLLAPEIIDGAGQVLMGARMLLGTKESIADHE